MYGTMKKIVVICSLVAMGLTGGTSYAAILSIDPGFVSTSIGETFDVDINIEVPENDDLGGFYINISYDWTMLSFSEYSLSEHLGSFSGPDPFWPDAEDWSQGDDGFGTVNLYVLSYLWDFSSQPDDFTLATISFTSIAEGESELKIDKDDPNNTLSDALGLPITIDESNSATVLVSSASVPEPSILFFIGAGLAGMTICRKRCC